MNGKVSRRRVLGTMAIAGTAGLAGCSDDEVTKEDAIESIDLNADIGLLAITLTPEHSADRISLEADDDQELFSRNVSSDQRAATFELFQPEDPDPSNTVATTQYQIIAYQDGETIDSTTWEVPTNPQITDVSKGRGLVVEVKNGGDYPVLPQSATIRSEKLDHGAATVAPARVNPGESENVHILSQEEGTLFSEEKCDTDGEVTLELDFNNPNGPTQLSIKVEKSGGVSEFSDVCRRNIATSWEVVE